jgi:hypothetical protein
MSFSGPLFAIGLALVFGSLYRALTGERLFETREDWTRVTLGVAMMAGALALWSRGVA